VSNYKKNIGAWKRSMVGNGWIGVDLDATLARYDGWHGPYHIGELIEPMAARVRGWLAAGIEVRIFTARASDGNQAVVVAIQDWTEKHFGQRLTVTCMKDFNMIQLWDDRAVQVVPNTGMRADDAPDECCYDGMCDGCLPPIVICVCVYDHTTLLPTPMQCPECGLVMQ
jgi:hypothetical protein